MKDVKERIKHIRSLVGLGQNEFAKTIGIKQGKLSYIESGRTEPQLSLINNICLIYNINPDWLKDGEGTIFDDGTDLFRKYAPMTKPNNPNLLESVVISIEEFIPSIDPVGRAKLTNYYFEHYRHSNKDIGYDTIKKEIESSFKFVLELLRGGNT